MSDQITFDPTTKIWTGPSRDYPYGNNSMAEEAYKHMKENSDFVSFIVDETGESFTYGDILKQSVSFATSLKEMGIKKGDMIILFTENYNYVSAAWLGVTMAGAILCPFVYTESSMKADTKELLDQIQPKLMITSHSCYVDEFKTMFGELKIDCPIYMYENKISGCHDLKPLLEKDVDVDKFKPATINDPDNDLLLLLLSSSTTGKSKLIKATQKQILSACIPSMLPKVIASTLKPGWITECIILFACILNKVTRIIRTDFTIDEILKMLERRKVNLLVTKPKDLFAAIHSDIIDTVDLSNLNVVFSTGEHLSVKVGEQFQKYIPNGVITVIYGMTDVGYSVTKPVLSLRPNLVGEINFNVNVKILDEEGENLGVNEVGEICVKSHAPFAGYYKNEKMTNENKTEDGYFKTGDIGYIDEKGHMYLVDRKKYRISYRNGWINQSRVERIIIENVKGILGVCVVDIEHKEHGVVPIIVIIPEKGVKLNEQDVIKTVYEHHEFPFETKVFFMDTLPITISGKYRKHIIREMILKMM